MLNLIVVLLGVGCGSLSTFYWIAYEVEHIWLRTGILSPVFLILIVLVWFTVKVDKERTKR